MTENPVEEVIHDVEDIFSPKPGGMIDRHRQAEARREAAQREAENAAERVEENASFAVKVTVIKPELVATTVINVASGGTAQILPLNKYRYRATIIATAAIVLAPNAGQALGGNGYPLPANTPIVIESRAQLYAYGGSPTLPGAATVSVIAEIYSPEQ